MHRKQPLLYSLSLCQTYDNSNLNQTPDVLTHVVYVSDHLLFSVVLFLSITNFLNFLIQDLIGLFKSGFFIV